MLFGTYSTSNLPVMVSTVTAIIGTYEMSSRPMRAGGGGVGVRGRLKL
jgi:hypothetical protein